MIGVTNLGQIKSRHSHFLTAQDHAIETEMVAAGRIAEFHPAQYATFKRRTHALERATQSKVVRTSGGRLLRVFNRKAYAGAIDTGAKPHRIVPRRASLLRFPGRDGKIVFARAVNHPGNKPYKFLYRATVAAGRALGPNLQTELSGLARKL